MNITQKDLLIMQNVAKACYNNCALPVLDNVYYNHKNQTVTATNLDMALVAGVTLYKNNHEPLDHDCLFSRTAIRELRKLKAPAVLPDEYGMEGVEDFPEIPNIQAMSSVTLDAGDIERIKWLLNAASKDSARPVLTGVHFAPDGRVAATDGYVLKTARVTSGLEEDLVLPASTLKKSISLFKQGGVLSMDGSGAVLDNGAYVMVMKMIDGTYPDIEKLKPDTNKAVKVCLRDAIIQNIGDEDITADGRVFSKELIRRAFDGVDEALVVDNGGAGMMVSEHDGKYAIIMGKYNK